MRITQAEQDARIARVIKVAYQLFSDNSIDKVNINMVADRAGVSHASISRYFGNKASLLYCTQQILWCDLVGKIISHNKKAFDGAKTGFERLKVVISGFDVFFNEYAGYIIFAKEYKLFLYRSDMRLNEEQKMAIYKPIYALFHDTIVEGQNDGSITTKYSSDSLYRYVWMSMRSLVEMMALEDRIYEAGVPCVAELKMAQESVLNFVKAK